MYSGAHLLALDDDLFTNSDPVSGKARTVCKSSQRLKLPDVDQKEEKLIYGLNSDADLRTVVFASFYEKELYLFRR